MIAELDTFFMKILPSWAVLFDCSAGDTVLHTQELHSSNAVMRDGRKIPQPDHGLRHLFHLLVSELAQDGGVGVEDDLGTGVLPHLEQKKQS